MRFDTDDVFGDDYLHFYDAVLDAEQSDLDADAVVDFLELESGELVLDAPCGHGRISNRLARRGIRVVGVDVMEHFLAVARSERTDADYKQGDLRALPVDGPFDAVFSWFSSFGYFDDDGNRQTLAEYRRVLRPGGRLLIEMHNRDEFVRRFTPAPFSITTWAGDDAQIDTTVFDCVEGRAETDRVIIRDGHVRRFHYSLRIPAISELRDWLVDAGFDEVRFCARDGSPPALDRRRLVVLATAA
jgi:SAM-dependent methyltransferase